MARTRPAYAGSEAESGYTQWQMQRAVDEWSAADREAVALEQRAIDARHHAERLRMRALEITARPAR